MNPDSVQRRTVVRYGEYWGRVVEAADPYAVETEELAGEVLNLAGPVEGRVVVDAGCGNGRMLERMAKAGAAEVIGFDLSDSVEAARARVARFPNARMLRGDVNHPPLPHASADVVYSIGVLHHLADPEAGFRALAALARPGGRVVVWVYAREGNERFIRWVDPWRRLTSRLPVAVNRVVAGTLAAAAWPVVLTSSHPYAAFSRRAGFRWFRLTVLDKMLPPVTWYLSRETVRGWFERAGMADVQFIGRNGNSFFAAGSLPLI